MRTNRWPARGLTLPWRHRARKLDLARRFSSPMLSWRQWWTARFHRARAAVQLARLVLRGRPDPMASTPTKSQCQAALLALRQRGWHRLSGLRGQLGRRAFRVLRGQLGPRDRPARRVPRVEPARVVRRGPPEGQARLVVLVPRAVREQQAQREAQARRAERAQQDRRG